MEVELGSLMGDDMTNLNNPQGGDSASIRALGLVFVLIAVLAGGVLGLMLSYPLAVDIAPKVGLVRYAILACVLLVVVGLVLFTRRRFSAKKSALYSGILAFLAAVLGVSYVIFFVCWVA